MSWQRIRGHDAVVRSFQQVLLQNRLAHAYLFVGPVGIGKQTFARELAKAVLCEAPRAGDDQLNPGGCEHCPACLQIEAGTHPDFVYAIRPEESHEFPIALMREVCARFALKPFRGGRKVILLDDADELNEESANCFLKTLEEPPPGALVLLISHSLDRQLPTIRSRCQVIRFAPLKSDQVIEVVQAKIAERGETITPAMQARLVRLSSGSPGQALALADPALWKFRASFVKALTASPVDSAALAREVMECVEAAGKESALQRTRARLVVRLAIDLISDVLALHQHHEPQRGEAEDQAALENLVRRTDTEAALGLLERCLEADRHIERRVQLILAVEAWLDTLARTLA